MQIKQTVITFIVVVMLASCGNSAQNKTQEDAKQLATGINKMDPDGIPTTAGRWTMTAKINGKDWAATTIMPLEATGRIIGDNNGESFGFPYNKSDMYVGEKEIFGEHNAVGMSTYEDGKLKYWDAVKGEMEITKVDGDWVEGKFFLTGSLNNSDKIIAITDGFFRISLAEKK